MKTEASPVQVQTRLGSLDAMRGFVMLGALAGQLSSRRVIWLILFWMYRKKSFINV